MSGACLADFGMALRRSCVLHAPASMWQDRTSASSSRSQSGTAGLTLLQYMTMPHAEHLSRSTPLALQPGYSQRRGYHLATERRAQSTSRIGRPSAYWQWRTTTSRDCNNRKRGESNQRLGHFARRDGRSDGRPPHAVHRASDLHLTPDFNLPELVVCRASRAFVVRARGPGCDHGDAIHVDKLDLLPPSRIILIYYAALRSQLCLPPGVTLGSRPNALACHWRAVLPSCCVGSTSSTIGHEPRRQSAIQETPLQITLHARWHSCRHAGFPPVARWPLVWAPAFHASKGPHSHFR